MNEKLIEKKLREAVKAFGGLALKFSSPYHRGMPDRVLLMPNGMVGFVEIKTTGKKPTELQKVAHKQLRELGFKVEVIDKPEQIEEFLNELK